MEQIPTDDGRLFEIIVPQNSKPGDYLTVCIPKGAIKF